MIAVSHLSKRYPGADTLSLDDVSFTVSEGEICGLLGRNGAGKSTTLNILTGCLAPSSGHVEIDGIDLWTDPVQAKRKIGYAPELPPLYPDMRLFEYLVFVCRAKSVSNPGEEAERVMEVTSMTRYASSRLAILSKGNRQRAGLAQALIGDPTILILDEPANGLDPEQNARLRALIAELGKKHTILLSSHILSEVSLLCGRIVLLSQGRLAAEDTAEGLKKRAGKDTLEEAFLALTSQEQDDEEPPLKKRKKR